MNRWCGARRCRRAPRRCCPRSWRRICWRSSPRAPISRRPWPRNCAGVSPLRLAPDAPEPTAPTDTTAEEALAQARALAARGELDEETLLAAARRGEARYAAALLAVAAGTPVSVVDRAVVTAQCQGTGEPGLEGGLHHAGGGRAADLAGAPGAGRGADRRAQRQLPAGRRGDALAVGLPRRGWGR